MRGTWGTQGFCLDYEISWTQHWDAGIQLSAGHALLWSCSSRLRILSAARAVGSGVFLRGLQGLASRPGVAPRLAFGPAFRQRS
jgi:hypothetical protein